MNKQNLERVNLVVGPELAKKWLDEQNNSNRNPSMNVVKAYASDMANGKWKLTHQNSIAFYKDGNIADGQHRLMAIVMSGVSIQLEVVYGLDKDSIFGIDAHYMRNTAAQIKMAGGNEWISNRHIAAYKTLVEMNVGRIRLSPQEIINGIQKKRECIDFVCSGLASAKSISVAPISAAIASAYDEESHARLWQFMEVMNSGLMVDVGDTAAIRLRERALADSRIFQSNQEGRKELYKLTQSAIKHFCNESPIKKLICPKELIYRVDIQR